MSVIFVGTESILCTPSSSMSNSIFFVNDIGYHIAKQVILNI
jgi:hypothetical protein